MELIGTLLGVPFVYLAILGLAPRRVRGLVVAAVLIALTLSWTPVTPTGVREAAIFGSAEALLLSLSAKRFSTGVRPLVPALVVVFFVSGLVSTWIVFPEGTPGFIRLALLGVLAVVVSAQFSVADRSTAIAGLLTAAVVQVVAGVMQSLSGTPPLWGFGRDDGGAAVVYQNPLLGDTVIRWQGTAGHPIPYAMVIVLALITVLATRMARRRKWVVVLVLAYGAALFFSGTRTALLAGLVAVCYLFLLSGQSKHRFWNYLAAVVIISGAYLLDFGLRSGVDELVDSGSFTNRQDALTSIVKLMGRSSSAVLFGNGAGSEQTLFAAGLLQQNGFNVIDNQLVTTLATQGILGAALLITIFLAALISGDRTKRALILVLIVMLFSFDYLRWPTMVVFALVTIGLPNGVPTAVASVEGAQLPERRLKSRVTGGWR